MHIRRISVINDDCQYECPYHCKNWKVVNQEPDKQGLYDRELTTLPMRVYAGTYHFVKHDIRY